MNVKKKNDNCFSMADKCALEKSVYSTEGELDRAKT